MNLGIEHPKIQRVVETTQHLNVLVYGKPKVGKTVFASTAPEPILYLDCEGGLISVREKNPYSWRIHSSDDMREAFKFLKHQDHDFQTVVLDSVSEMHRIIVDEFAESTAVQSYQVWNDVQKTMSNLLRSFRDLPMHTIFTALEEAKEDDSRILIMPDLFGKMSRQLAGYVDCVFRYTIRRKQNPAEGESEVERVLLTQSTDKILAGYRSSPNGNPKLEKYEVPDFSIILNKLLGNPETSLEG